MSMLQLLNPEMRARRELSQWERDTELEFSEDDKNTLISLMMKIFSNEDASHLSQDEIEVEEFSDDEKTIIEEIAKKYPIFSIAIMDFFRNLFEEV